MRLARAGDTDRRVEVTHPGHRPITGSAVRSWFGLAVAALSLAPAACGLIEDPPATRSNLLLISIDTLRPDHLRSYGYDRDTAPTLDALASRGVLFRDVSATAPWTLPAHASLLSGTYPSTHGVKDHIHKLSASLPTLATQLSQHGYRTAAVVNSHNLTGRYGLDQGFQSFEYVSEWSEPEKGRKHLDEHAETITTTALEMIRAAGGRPFFVFVHFYDVHSDFSPPERYRKRFVRPYSGKIDGTTPQLLRIRRRGDTLGQQDVLHLRDLYDAEIRELDDWLSLLFRTLKDDGILDDTIVVVVSDHGEEFMEHGSVLHGRTHYQEVIAVPWMMAGPGIPRGGVVDVPVSLVDVAPTLLSLLEIPASAPMDGSDVTSLWGGAPDTRLHDRALLSEADHKNAEPDIRRMVRQGSYKLIYDRLTRTSRLYDLDRDPAERHDLSASEPGRLAAMRALLERIPDRPQAGDAIPPPDPEDLDRLRALGYLE